MSIRSEITHLTSEAAHSELWHLIRDAKWGELEKKSLQYADFIIEGYHDSACPFTGRKQHGNILHELAYSQHADAVDAISKGLKKAKVRFADIVDDQFNLPTHYQAAGAAKYKGDFGEDAIARTMEVLEGHGYKYGYKNFIGTTPLGDAIAGHNYHVLNVLLERGGVRALEEQNLYGHNGFQRVLWCDFGVRAKTMEHLLEHPSIRKATDAVKALLNEPNLAKLNTLDSAAWLKMQLEHFQQTKTCLIHPLMELDEAARAQAAHSMHKEVSAIYDMLKNKGVQHSVHWNNLVEEGNALKLDAHPRTFWNGYADRLSQEANVRDRKFYLNVRDESSRNL